MVLLFEVAVGNQSLSGTDVARLPVQTVDAMVGTSSLNVTSGGEEENCRGSSIYGGHNGTMLSNEDHQEIKNN